MASKAEKVHAKIDDATGSSIKGYMAVGRFKTRYGISDLTVKKIARFAELEYKLDDYVDPDGNIRKRKVYPIEEFEKAFRIIICQATKPWNKKRYYHYKIGTFEWKGVIDGQ